MTRALRSMPDRLGMLEARVDELAAQLRAYDALIRAQRATQDLARATVQPHGHSTARMSTICEVVAEKFGVTVADIRGRDAGSLTTRARQEAMRLMHEAGHSLQKIGLYLDGRDHSTVFHGIRKARARLEAGQ